MILRTDNGWLYYAFQTVIRNTNKSSAVAEMGDRLATIDMGQKVGAAVPPFRGGELGPHLTQCRLGRGLPPYQWCLNPCNRLATRQRHRQTGQTTVR